MLPSSLRGAGWSWVYEGLTYVGDGGGVVVKELRGVFRVVSEWMIIIWWRWRGGVRVVGSSGIEVIVDGFLMSPVVCWPPC